MDYYDDAPTGAMVVREDTLGGIESVAQVDISPTAAAEAARARVETMATIAHRFGRNEDAFRDMILRMCAVPRFADAALYKRPVGRKKNDQGEWENEYAIGFSVRFIEAALKHYRHIDTAAAIVAEDRRKVVVQVSVLDVYNNVCHSRSMVIEKLTEKKDLKGRPNRGERTNTYGDKVFLTDSTPDELRLKVQAEASKLFRDNGRRILPPDILEEARAAIEKTQADQNARDPNAAKKKVLDRFSAVGVTPDELRAYMGRALEALTLADIAELTEVYNAIKGGDTTWAEVVAIRTAPAEGEEKKEPKKVTTLRARVQGARRKAVENAPQAQAQPQAAPVSDANEEAANGGPNPQP